MEGAKENVSWRQPWSECPAIPRQGHSDKASLPSGWEVSLWVRTMRSPGRQVILGTSPVMSLAIQVRCQKYDFLSAVNSTLRSPLPCFNVFQMPPSVWFAQCHYYSLLKEICSSKIMHLRQKLPLSAHQNCSTAQVKTSTLDWQRWGILQSKYSKHLMKTSSWTLVQHIRHLLGHIPFLIKQIKLGYS